MKESIWYFFFKNICFGILLLLIAEEFTKRKRFFTIDVNEVYLVKSNIYIYIYILLHFAGISNVKKIFTHKFYQKKLVISSIEIETEITKRKNAVSKNNKPTFNFGSICLICLILVQFV